MGVEKDRQKGKQGFGRKDSQKAAPSPLTDGQGHHPEMVANQFHHLALLQGGGSAADHGLTAGSQLQELPLQTLLQSKLQGLPGDDEASPQPGVLGGRKPGQTLPR